MHIDLAGKSALVTGATGELGRVIARTLARCGADVAIHFHSNCECAEILRAELEEMGRRAAIFQADIANRSEVFAMREAVTEQLGAPDIVVNNAVSQYRWTTVLEQAEADYESQFRSCPLLRAAKRADGAGVRARDDRERRQAHHRHQHRVRNASG